MIPKPEFQQANLFELSGDGIQVTYSSTSIAGTPLFSYRDGNINRLFTGEEIRGVQTEIGDLLTVTLEEILDLRTVAFTLILPVVNVLPGSTGLHIRVPGITTTTHTSIAGSVFGPQRTYSLVKLEGTAQAAIF